MTDGAAGDNLLGSSAPPRATPAATRAGLGAVGLLAATALLFWWPCLAGGKVPVAAVYQQQMPAREAPPGVPPVE